MKNKNVTHSFIRCTIAMVLFSFMASAQQPKEKNKRVLMLYQQANNHSVRGEYQQAISSLEQTIKKDKYYTEAYLLLATIYQRLGKFKLSNDILRQGLALCIDEKKCNNFLFELGNNFLSQGNYDQALSYLDEYLTSGDSIPSKLDRAKRWKQNAEYGLYHEKDDRTVFANALSPTVNSYALQYFPTLTADSRELIFTRRRSAHPSDDEDLVVSMKDDEGNWRRPISLSPYINSQYNEGACAISANGSFLVFTSCMNKKGYGGCDLFYSRRIGKTWSMPLNMGSGVNSSAWESQPTLSNDGRVLYFSSDRKNGEGGRDIYVSYRDKQGVWSKAKNVGTPINTFYDEISPFIHISGRRLFFSSNGMPGFGGYDIYESNKTEQERWGRPVNMGLLVNDHKDQFSFFISADGKKGYYAHEQGGGTRFATSRLMEITIPESMATNYRSIVLKGIVRDEETLSPVYAQIELFDLERRSLLSVMESDSLQGNYLLAFAGEADYALYVDAPGYLFYSLNVSTLDDKNKAGQPIIQDIYLKKLKKGMVVRLSNIFFEFDRYLLGKKSQIELNKMVEYLSSNPLIHVEIGGHTDDKGAYEYNKNLSLQRARAVRTYLINKGIQRERLKEKGYGSEHPVVLNDTEKGRSTNRRIEFKIL